MQKLAKIDLKDLYEVDEHLWLEETIKLLKSKCLDALDIDNLIEELESLSRSEKAKVARFLELIIIHLLLCQFWAEESEYNLNYWKTKLISFRSQIERLLTTNLRNYLENELPKIYRKSLKYVRQKTQFKVTFPNNCPYNLQQLLDEDWLPNN
ncbi:MAG TPA: DUF29 domain-containing protein [Cyanothece sp. UBA12306]|nr:DUF29 domain-containing protein [Cyanothece sp. UBA12306]